MMGRKETFVRWHIALNYIGHIVNERENGRRLTLQIEIARKGNFENSKHVYSIVSLLCASNHDSLFSLFPRRKGHNCPLSTPCPFSGTAIATSSFHGSELLILTRLETNHNISFASSQS
jgi:hypothetical protein